MRVRASVVLLALAALATALLLFVALLPGDPVARRSGGAVPRAGEAGADAREVAARGAGVREWPPRSQRAARAAAPAAERRSVFPALALALAPAAEPEASPPRLALATEFQGGDVEAARDFRLDREEAAQLADQLDLVDRELVDRSVAALARAPGETQARFAERQGETRASIFARAFLNEYRYRSYLAATVLPNGMPAEVVHASIASGAMGDLPEEQAQDLRLALQSFDQLPTEPVYDPDPRNVWRARAAE